MNNVDFWKLFWSVMGPLILGALTWIGKSVKDWFKNKASNEKNQKMIDIIGDIVVNAVLCITQTFVDDLKKNNQFTDICKQEAKDKAYAIVISQLTPKLQTFIQDNFGDVKEYIMNLIEAKICILKN